MQREEKGLGGGRTEKPECAATQQEKSGEYDTKYSFRVYLAVHFDTWIKTDFWFKLSRV